MEWPNELPSGAPFEHSSDFSGMVFTGRYATYTDADTWYPSWAADGDLYSPWTDGAVNGQVCLSFNQRHVNKYHLGLDPDTPASTGQAPIIGDDPLKLEIINLGTFAGDPTPYSGRYPGGSLVHHGVWYYGTYTLEDFDGACGNWCTLGPFVGFRASPDGGRTWTETPHTPAAPLFGESGGASSRVKIGAPHVVDFGRDLEHSPDGKAYLVAHGASGAEGWANWIAGDAIYLLRVTLRIKWRSLVSVRWRWARQSGRLEGPEDQAFAGHGDHLGRHRGQLVDPRHPLDLREQTLHQAEVATRDARDRVDDGRVRLLVHCQSQTELD